MTGTPAGQDRGIHVSGHGTFTGNAQTGDHSSATFTSGAGAADAEQSAEIVRLREAVEALRARLRDLDPAELSAAEGTAAESALAEVEDALPDDGEAGQGRVRNAFFTVAGALASVASLSESVRALRDAAAPWL
ncbi:MULTISPECIES: DUF5955 family protein [unclassified Streptomyces]|uniref:DUF5955 family protein n=1 Tax=unclassified Streptomyces TaxID=2593676 RepID=UPI002E0FF9F3|nr:MULTISPECIES: DUF5955 family protein [unclassified Streptomyces]WSQ85729.1 DUF5955 family protein [Streptomyces sp. NBC_01212]WSR08178.1 DUF5955 family protein [Streptomyces sp. NBC_01208]